MGFMDKGHQHFLHLETRKPATVYRLLSSSKSWQISSKKELWQLSSKFNVQICHTESLWNRNQRLTMECMFRGSCTSPIPALFQMLPGQASAKSECLWTTALRQPGRQVGEYLTTLFDITLLSWKWPIFVMLVSQITV